MVLNKTDRDDVGLADMGTGYSVTMNVFIEQRYAVWVLLWKFVILFHFLFLVFLSTTYF